MCNICVLCVTEACMERKHNYSAEYSHLCNMPVCVCIKDHVPLQQYYLWQHRASSVTALTSEISVFLLPGPCCVHLQSTTWSADGAEPTCRRNVCVCIQSPGAIQWADVLPTMEISFPEELWRCHPCFQRPPFIPSQALGVAGFSSGLVGAGMCELCARAPWHSVQVVKDHFSSSEERRAKLLHAQKKNKKD